MRYSGPWYRVCFSEEGEGVPSDDQCDSYQGGFLPRVSFVMGNLREDTLSRVIQAATPERTAQRLCEVCADVTGVASAAIVLLDDEVGLGSLPATDPVAARIALLQRDRCEGPVVDAYRFGLPVYEPNLDAPHVAPKWPIFQPAAIQLGVRAAFAVPLRVGSCRLGAISLQSDRLGPLTADQQAAALMMSTLAAQAILVLKANPPPGRLVKELQSFAEYDMAVIQAAGMVSVQINRNVTQALIHMRMHAFSNDTTLIDVARQVVARTLRFDADSRSSF